MKSLLLFVCFFVAFCWSQDLDVSTTISLGGLHTYNNVIVRSNGRINVPRFDGSSFTTTGYLEIIANTVTIDGIISARGSGWQPVKCNYGNGFNSLEGGRGGCAVQDSGGGGAHYSEGGPGTRDINGNFDYLTSFEQSCPGSPTGAHTCGYVNCRGNSAYPTTEGIRDAHSVYDYAQGRGMGAAGGDAGCGDGDGWSNNIGTSGPKGVGGAGGGIIVIRATGDVNVTGQINSDGERGCGVNNDSGGGGAGGTILITAASLNMGTSATITANGGLGGDSQPKDLNVYSECTSTQLSGACDDCGGGGAGGIVYVLAPLGNYRPLRFGRISTNGAVGGACPVCRNEARGGDGEVQWGHELEICDGVDNTFDGDIDEGTITCPGGSIPMCINGQDNDCPPTTGTTQSTGTTADTTGSTGTTSTGTTGTTARLTTGTTGRHTTGTTAVRQTTTEVSGALTTGDFVTGDESTGNQGSSTGQNPTSSSSSASSETTESLASSATNIIVSFVVFFFSFCLVF